MKRVIVVTLLALFSVCCEAGLFKNSVDLADLAEVPAAALSEMKETEFGVFLAQVGLSSAKAAERRAAGAGKAAGRILETEKLDLKAAEAEVKAAKANQDVERLTAAETVLTSAERDQRIARQFLGWKEHERETRQAEEKTAAIALDLAEARRDRARAELLARNQVPAAGKYDISDLSKTVRKRQTEYDNARRKAGAKSVELEKLEREWLALARAVGVPAEGPAE